MQVAVSHLIVLLNCVAIDTYHRSGFSKHLLTYESVHGRRIDIKGNRNVVDSDEIDVHSTVVQMFYEQRRDWHTSNLGSLLFKNLDKKTSVRLSRKKKKIFMIYIWNEWSILDTGFDLNEQSLSSALHQCSVKNCMFTRIKKYRDTADAILVNVHRGEIPKVPNRNQKQIWVLYSVESPFNTFSSSKYRGRRKLSEYADIFNWTMTYRADSDVPIPYGRVVPLVFPAPVDLSKPGEALFELVPYWMQKQTTGRALATVVMSNCRFRNRKLFLYNLMRYFHIDVFGKCSYIPKNKNVCPGHIRYRCDIPEKYLFYLVLENSGCQQYMTEKVFYNSYSNGAIPIIWRIPLNDCVKFLPPHSYIHVDHYKSIEELARHVKRISRDDKELLSYHWWRKHFKVVNEHGYFGTTPVHFCRLCEALNYNENIKRIYEYSDLKMFLDPKVLCVHENLADYNISFGSIVNKKLFYPSV